MSVELALAGRWRRLTATLIDFVLVPAVAILLMLATGVLEHAEDWGPDSRPGMRILLLGIAGYLLLNGYLLWKRGQTVGKAITNIAIVSTATGETLAVWKLILVRALFFPMLYLIVVPWVTLLPLLDQFFIFGKRRRCLHDLVCGSSVVRLGREAAASTA